MTKTQRFMTVTFQKQRTATTLSVFAFLLCGMANTFIAGRALGSNGLAVMSLVNPVYLTLTTLGSLVGVGASLVAAQHFGRCDAGMVRQVFTLSVFLVIGIPMAFCIVCLIFMNGLLGILSVPPELYADAERYLRYLLGGGLFVAAIYLPFNFLKLIGRAYFGSVIYAIMAVINIALDYVFLYSFGMGIEGIALALVLSAAITAALGILGIFHSNGDLRFCKVTRWRDCAKSILAVGTPSALNNLCGALRTVLLNGIVVSAVGALGLSALSVISVINSMARTFYSGTMQAMTPFISALRGEHDVAGIREIERSALAFSVCVVGVISAITLLFPGWICGIYSITDAAAVAITVPAIRFFGVSLVFATINFWATSVNQALWNTRVSNVLTLFGTLILPVAFMYLGSFFGNAIWSGFLAAELATLGGYLFYVWLRVRSGKPSGLLPADLLGERIGREQIFMLDGTDEAAARTSEQVNEFCEEQEVEAKTAMVMSLAVEEMLVLCNQQAPATMCGVRVLLLADSVVLTIRHNGKPFNPFTFAELPENRADEGLGIQMVKALSNQVQYNMAFGLNNLTVGLRRE